MNQCLMKIVYLLFEVFLKCDKYAHIQFSRTVKMGELKLHAR